MLINRFGKFTSLVTIVFLFAGFTVYAQPPKKRGVANKPKPAATPAQPQQTSPLPASIPQTPKKKTIVVLDFNDVSLTADSVKRPIGKQLAVLLTTEFARRGNFSVISQRDKEIAEERIKSLKEGKDRSYAAKIGKQLSANLVVFGDLIEYTIVTETSNKYIKKDIKHSAKVGFTLTLVDISTNEVKDGVSIEYIATSKDTDFGVYNKSKPLTEDQRITMLTEASKVGVIKAVDKLDQLIVATASPGASSVATTKPADVPSNQNITKPVEANNIAPSNNTSTESEERGKKKKGGLFGTGIFGGGKDKEKKESQKNNNTTSPAPVAPSSSPSANMPRIAAIDGQEVYVKNLPAGTKVGTKLIAYQIGKVLKDEVTGEILKQEELTIAELEVVSVTDNSFVCKITSGSGLTTKALIKIAR